MGKRKKEREYTAYYCRACTGTTWVSGQYLDSFGAPMTPRCCASDMDQLTPSEGQKWHKANRLKHEAESVLVELNRSVQRRAERRRRLEQMH